MKVGAVNPVTGNKMDLSPKGILMLIVGTVVLLFAIGSGQKLSRFAESKINNQFIDGTPSAFTKDEIKVVNSKRYIG